MVRASLLIAALIALFIAPAHADKVTLALSTNDIQINANFNGMSLTLFGVIEGEEGQSPISRDHQVAVVLLGPRQTTVVRRKDRVAGIWANSGGQTILNPPSFYAVNTSAPVNEVAAPAVLDRLQIGFDHLSFVYQGRALMNDPAAQEFREAYIRLKQEAGLFKQLEGVTFFGDYAFRASVFMPASIPVGTYTAIAYVLADGELVARAEDTIIVSKTGFEATMTNFARNQSLVYGILCVALALAIGWLGGVIFRRD
jgi:uncharacterized protein (TIGR02186 family)